SELFFQKLLQRIEELEKIVRDQEEFLAPFSRKMTLLSAGEEVTMVTWEELEQAIADGWKASQGSLEPAPGVLKHKGKTSSTSIDASPTRASIQPSSIDQGLDSASDFGPPLTLSGASGSGYPSEGVLSRDRSRLTSGRGQPRVRDEAGLAKFPQPPVSQFRMESDQYEPREQPGLARLRGDGQAAYAGPVQQDLPLTRDGQQLVYPDRYGRMNISQGQVYARPDQYELGPPGLDQRERLPPTTYPHGIVPFRTDQLGMMPPAMNEPGLLLPGRDQQGLELPTAEQPAVVPLSTDQRGVRLYGTDQRAVEQPAMDESGVGPLGRGQQRFKIFGMDQQGLVPPFTDQHVWGAPGLMQVATDEQGFAQPSLETPGFLQPGTQQQDVIQPGAVQPGLVQPGAVQPGLVQPGMDQRGLVQPGPVQPGLVQPGMDQRGLVQPGPVQPGLVQPGMDQRGLVQPGPGQPGLVQPGAVQPGLVQPGLVQPGAVQPGLVQPGLVQPGAVQPGLVQPGMDQRGLVQPGPGQPGLVQPGAVQPGLVQPGLVQPGAVQPGLVQPGMDQRGLVQPGAGQRGLVQPGAGQPGLVQPGAGQPGLVQPGTVQRGLVQPGAVQPGLVQPGPGQPGLVQPGAVQPGLVQPGMDQRGLVQPGAGQRGLVQPGAVQPGLVQPGAVQPALVQPGMDQRGFVQPGIVQPGLVQSGIDQRGFVQPGAVQPGLFQPGMDQRGLFQPGVGQRGLVQPGVDQRGLVQTGAYPHSLVQPGAYPHVLVQPGAGQPGLVQPGAGQPGLVQPGAGQPGLVQPGAELHGHADSRTFVSPRPYQHGVIPPGRDQQRQQSPHLAKQGLKSQEGLVPTETDQQDSMHPDTAQRGSVPLSTGVESAHPDEQLLESPGPDQRDHAYSIPDSHYLMYPGPHGPGYPGVEYVQIDLGPYSQTVPSQDGTFPRSADSLGYLRRVSSERSDIPSGKRDSLEKVAPSFPMAVETFRLIGELIGLYVELKEKMKDLDEERAGQTDLEKIQHMLAVLVHKTIPADLPEQLKSIKNLTREVRQEKAKMEKIQRLLEGPGAEEVGKELKPGHLGLQLGILRASVADIEKELAELRESQERGKVMMEHSVSEASLYLQDQLDKLRTIIENMLASSSTLLSMSMAPAKTLPTVLAPGQIDPQSTCPACSLDFSHQVSILVQRYEQLQNMVNSLAASRPSKKAKLQSQDEELLGHVQSAILQVQGDCEKLNIITSSLIEDHRQKQKDIDVLYQGLEKLEKEKANREHLEMEIDVKADKSALACKVSRVQFDATTEQLNHMMQELVAKMSGQEQDWQKMLDKLLVEMDSKLDRLELDPVKQLLEDRWRSLRQQLKERSPHYQADEAACMRRQLLAHFHCLSCDRPLETPVTGQIIPMTPVGQGLPGHRSTRPYLIFELEQIRQQNRNLKLGGGTFPRADLASMERSVGRLRSMHSKMLMDIEKVQIHFGGSVKASSQMIHELLQAQCLSNPCPKRVSDISDYTYSAMPRRCGGSHTLTYPYRRSRLQHLPQGPCPEEIQIAMKHDEVDILGLDGHIYKGRMDKRLPGIPSKDSLGNTRHKAKSSRPHVHRQPTLSDSGQLPTRPRSAQMLAGNTSAPPRQRTDRPVSSEGRLSQTTLAHLPSAREPAAGLEMPLDLPPAEGQEEPTRGPRSMTLDRWQLADPLRLQHHTTRLRSTCLGQAEEGMLSAGGLF
ncbi:glutamine-rich protein 2, partial [Molossus molossus]|uniref:glutamine-rich protein 2 n=1 Tax=Molossus molossus TaxID=27622 RepID=UPI001746C8C9